MMNTNSDSTMFNTYLGIHGKVSLFHLSPAHTMQNICRSFALLVLSGLQAKGTSSS